MLSREKTKNIADDIKQDYVGKLEGLEVGDHVLVTKTLFQQKSFVNDYFMVKSTVSDADEKRLKADGRWYSKKTGVEIGCRSVFCAEFYNADKDETEAYLSGKKKKEYETRNPTTLTAREREIIWAMCNQALGDNSSLSESYRENEISVKDLVQIRDKVRKQH